MKVKVSKLTYIYSDKHAPDNQYMAMLHIINGRIRIDIHKRIQ